MDRIVRQEQQPPRAYESQHGVFRVIEKKAETLFPGSDAGSNRIKSLFIQGIILWVG